MFRLYTIIMNIIVVLGKIIFNLISKTTILIRKFVLLGSPVIPNFDV